MKERYRLLSDCDAGFGTREEWHPSYFDNAHDAKLVRDMLDSQGGRSTMIVVVFPGDWHYKAYLI